MGLKEKTVSGVKWNTISTVVTMLIQVVQLAILTHLLEKSDFGIVAIASLVMSFTDIFSELGITIALIHKQNITDEEYSSVYWMNITVSIVLCLLTLFSAPLVSRFYDEPILTKIVSLFSLKILFNAFGKMFHTIKVKNLEFGFISKVRILTAFLGMIVTVTLAYMGMGVMSLVYGQLFTVALHQSIYAISGWHSQKILFHFSFKEAKSFLSIGLYQLGAHVVDFVASRLDVFLIGKFFSMEELGVYNIAKDLVIKPYSIINSITTNVFSSAFAKIQNDLHSLVLYFNKLIKATAVIAVPIYAILFIASNFVVSILYAPSFSEVAVYIRFLAVYGVFSAITSQAGSLMIAKGRTDLGLRWAFIRIILSVVFLFIFVYFGLYAVAAGQSLMAVVGAFIYFFVVIKPVISISIVDYSKQFGWIIVTTSFAVSLLWFLMDLVGHSVFMQICASILYFIMFTLYIYKYHRDIFEDFLKSVKPVRRNN